MPPVHPESAGASRSVRDLARHIAEQLDSAGIAGAEAEARDIVAALHHEARYWVATHADHPVSDRQWQAAIEAAARRKSGAPLAYAVGNAAFRDLTLLVDERVLIPRPETELLVDIALALVPAGGGTAIDVGTGSGAIALALASTSQFDRVLAGDLSADAIAVAAANAERLGLSGRVEFHCGSALAPFAAERARLIVSNPPYIALREAAALPPDVRDWEPAVALFGGQDGMDVIRRIIREAHAVLEPGGWLVMEVDSRRADIVAAALSKYDSYTDIDVRLDLAGRPRFVLARLRETQ